MKKILTFNLFFFLTTVELLFIPHFVSGAIPNHERAALIALYNSMNGDNWNDNSGWKALPLDTDGFALPGTEATWRGVYINGDHVIRIEDDANNHTGQIPPELGNLVYLGILSLQYTNIGGNIPAEIENLSNLRVLKLDGNQLVGNIPPELGNMSSLSQIYLGGNQLSGSIPRELGNLSNLTILYLSQNQLSGTIPIELCNLHGLYSLMLSLNQLSGTIPKKLGDLSNLTVLELNNNDISGNIPPELGNLANLSYLVLKGNDLSGNIPPELGNLSNLTWLSLNDNILDGGIPSELGNLAKLEVLSINNNRLSGEIPPNLMNLHKLEKYGLEIRHNCLYTNDPNLRIWLNFHDPLWDNYQDACLSENEIPIANAGINQTIIIGEVVTLDGTDSYDPDGVITSYLWNFGDNCSDEEETIVTHRYTLPGIYLVSLTVTDDLGATSIDELVVTVITPRNAIDILIDEVLSLGLHPFIENRLVSQLSNAIRLLDESKFTPVIQQLYAFINHVKAQDGKKIQSDTADQLIDLIERIIISIQCGEIVQSTMYPTNLLYEYSSSFLIPQVSRHLSKHGKAMVVSIKEPGHVVAELIDEYGEVVNVLERYFMITGFHVLYWDGKDSMGNIVQDGDYLCSIRLNNNNRSIRLIKILREKLK